MAGIERVRAILLSEEDDVATVFTALSEGEEIGLSTGASSEVKDSVIVRHSIPAGHKIACRDKRSGEIIYKYGQPIGRATADIHIGDHVHVHNMQSTLTHSGYESCDVPLLCSHEWFKDAIYQLMKKVGASEKAAGNLSDALTEAHLRGVETHGIRRLRPYVERIVLGSVDAQADPAFKEKGSLVVVDGKNGIGHHVAAMTADIVREMAREHGVALAVIRDSNHFGFAGYYATRIAKYGQIGFVISNGQVCVSPPGGKAPVFSNNPVAIAAPLGEDRYFELDMATSVISRAKIAKAAERGELIPLGLAADEEGRETRNPHDALRGSLLPFGGEKGFAFLYAMEVLTGILSGGAFARQVSSKESNPAAPERVSQFVMAIDIESAIGVNSFTDRLDDLIEMVRSIPRGEDYPDLRFPGQRRWQLRGQRLEKGIPLSPSEHADLMKLMNQYGVKAD